MVETVTRALWQGQPGALHRAGRQGMCTRERREHGHARTARTPPGAEPSGRVAAGSRAPPVSKIGQSVYPWLGQRALRAPLGTGRRVFAHRPGTATGAQVNQAPTHAERMTDTGA